MVRILLLGGLGLLSACATTPPPDTPLEHPENSVVTDRPVRMTAEVVHGEDELTARVWFEFEEEGGTRISWGECVLWVRAYADPGRTRLAWTYRSWTSPWDCSIRHMEVAPAPSGRSFERAFPLDGSFYGDPDPALYYTVVLNYMGGPIEIPAMRVRRE